MNTYLTSGNEKDCCGCLSCMYSCPVGAITAEKRFDEFSYPKLDADKCINCGKCKTVCPIDNVEKLVKPIKSTYALKHKDTEIRKNSSSGGAFTAISDYLMGEGYKVYGAVFDESYHYVNHIGSYKKEDRDKMRISKYVESSVKDIFPEIKKSLDEGGKVFFTGTPCQSSGLKAFLQKDYDNLFVMDFSCHGVTSPKVISDYIDLLSNGSKVSYFAFRDNKNNNWAKSQTPYIECEDKSNLNLLSYCYRIISRSIGLRSSCSDCKFAQKNRASDITVGDLWSINWLCPEINDDYGVSFFAVNTKKGHNMLKNIYETCDIYELNLEKAISGVGQLNAPAKGSAINDMFWNYYRKHSAEKTFAIYGGDSLYSKLRRKPFEIINQKLKK